MESLRKSFLTKYGDSNKIKENVEAIQTSILDINSALITIKKLHVQLNTSLSELTEELGSLVVDNASFADVLSEYKEWLKGMNKQAIFSIIGFEIQAVVAIATLPSIIASAASALTVGLAIVGSLVAVGLALADIISSVNEEKELKVKLTKARSEYIRARTNLQNAHASMKLMQKSFCKNIVNFLRKLSETGRKYDKLFLNLYNYIVKIYGSSGNSCEKESIFSKTNLIVLMKLRTSYIEPLLNYLAKNVKIMRKKVEEISIKIQLMKEISRSVRSGRKNPSKIFETVKIYGRQNSHTFFSNLYELLRYISKDVLPDTDCYWGHNLALVRSGETTVKNYLNSTICLSSEIQAEVDIIKESVKKGTVPCLIYSQVRGNEFRSKYLVLRFIAEHIIPQSNCYWGFDLQTLRNNPNASEIEKSKVSSSMFTVLNIFQYSNITHAVVQKARTFMCSDSLICNPSWQSFILCALWKNVTTPAELDCMTKFSSGREEFCVPSPKQFQECKS